MNKLHLAVRNQTLDELANLLKDEDAKTMLGGEGATTPLHLAAELGYAEVAALLMAQMSDVNVRDAEGKTALDVAMDKSQALAAKAAAHESVLHQANLKALKKHVKVSTKKRKKAATSSAATPAEDGEVTRATVAKEKAAKEVTKMLACAKVIREHGGRVSYTTSTITKVYLFSVLCVFAFLVYETLDIMERRRDRPRW